MMLSFATASRLLGCVAVLALGACVSTQYAAIPQGDVATRDLQMTTTDTLWNRAPQSMTAHLHSGSEMWTRDGPQLDRVLVLSSIGNGQTLFKSGSKSLVYPEFYSRMLPNEIVELNEASFAKLLGTEVLVTSSNLRPKQLSGQRAAMFDLTVSSADGPTMLGRVASFVHDDRLFEIVYLAAELHYFDKHWAAVLALIESARTGLPPPTGR